MKLTRTTSGSTTDFELDLTPSEAKAAGIDAGDDTTVLSLLAETLSAGQRWNAIRARARRNSRFVAGDQWEDFRFDADGTRQTESYRPGRSNTPYTVRNLLRNPHASLSSRVLEGKKTIKAWAGTTEVEDVAAADVANHLIVYYTNETDLERKDFEAAGKAQCHGVVYFRPRWDASLGPVSAGEQETETVEYEIENEDGTIEIEARDEPAIDEDGEPLMFGVGEREGDIAIDVVSVHEVTTDGSPAVEDSAWCVFHSLIDKHEATAMLRAAKIKEDPQPVDDVDDLVASFYDADTTAASVDGVAVHELWFRPSTRVPGGLYAEIVGGQVTVATPYPYDHEQLPLCAWRWAAEGDMTQMAPLTHVDDAINEQVAINKLLGAIDYLTSKMSRTIAHGPPAAREIFVNEESDFIELATPDLAAAIGYVVPPPIPPILGQQLEERRSALYETFGLTDQMSGVSKVGSSTAARTIAYQSELAALKLMGTALNYDSCKRRLWGQVLALVKQYVVSERRLKILGEGNEFKDIFFIGADIDGRDVRLEASAATTSAGTAAEAEAQVAAGTMDPALGAEIGDTGLGVTLDEGQTRIAVAQQIKDVMAGVEMPQAYPDVDPVTAATVVREALSVLGELPELQQLLAAYSQGATQGAPPPEAGAPAPDPQQMDQMAAAAGLNTGVVQ